MRVLVADDDAITRRVLSSALVKLGFDVLGVDDGAQAWAELQRPDAPRLALLDWSMRGLDGVDVCRKLRHAGATPRYVYTILVTSRSAREDIVAGFEAGADDFIAKPIELDELRVRIRSGQRIVELQAENERARSYLSTVLANIDSGALLTDAAGQVVLANGVFSQMFGTRLDQAVGAQRLALLEQQSTRFDFPEDFMNRVNGLLPSGEHVDFETSAPTSRVLRWSAKPVALPEGQGQLDLYRDVTRDVKRERERERLVRVDHLTGLYNRRGAEEAIARELARTRRYGYPMSIVLFDIDHFKRVNDSHGHLAGDRVLRHVSHVVNTSARGSDVVVRWGGEELLAVLPETPQDGAQIFAERVRRMVQNMEYEDLPRVTVSGGVAEVNATEPTIEPALARADTKLYEAKSAGRNAVR